MSSRKRGLLSGGSKNPKPKPPPSSSTPLTPTSSIFKSSPTKMVTSSQHSPDLFNIDEDDDNIEILEPTPKRRQLHRSDFEVNPSVSSKVFTRSNQRFSQTSMSLSPKSMTTSQRSITDFLAPREELIPVKRRISSTDDTAYQFVKKSKMASPVPENDDVGPVMKLRVRPPKKTFQKAAQGSQNRTTVSQKILCSQMSTWCFS